MATKVKGVHLKGTKGDGPVLGQNTTIRVDGRGQGGGCTIPRYEKSGFKQIETPGSPGKIKRYTGGKLFRDGVVRYPANVDVDPVHAAKVQALMDYNGQAGNPAPRKDMLMIYGEAYLKEFQRLERVKNYQEKD